jgi:glycosyltransferase involved in cell wall biosynthesis
VPYPSGTATFTYDLATAAFPRQIVALHPVNGPEAYPVEVRYKIRRDEREDYTTVAEGLNASGADVVSLQFEHHIWGGDDGAYVLDFLDALRLPVVTTLHSVVRKPTAGQRRLLGAIVDRSDAAVVMSAAAASLATRAYGIDSGRLETIPHGVPNLPLVDPDAVKPRLGLEGRLVILGFGLLGPGKGYEAVIEAMPALVEAHPTALFVILGATHPDILAADGETYREQLAAMAERLGVTDHVRFIDRFVGRVELGTWLEAADVFVAPYRDADRTVSGTLAYAMGAGKAVVSTPSACARELLAARRGMVIAAGDATALGVALQRLLADPALRAGYGRRAYEHTRDMVWSAVGGEYRRIFTQVTRPTTTDAFRSGKLAATRG